MNQTVNAFLQIWKQRLLKVDGDHVWIHLTGFDCYDTIPRFARYVERKLRELDRQILEQHGLHALIQYWRAGVKDFQNLDDKAVLEARIAILDSLHPLMSEIAWVAFWAESFEKAQDNICKIRPEVKTWIARHEKEYNISEAFGGLLPYQL